jgi:hypothetical protein
LTARLDRERERSEDRHISGDDPTALSQPTVVVIVRIIGDADQTARERAHACHRSIVGREAMPRNQLVTAFADPAPCRTNSEASAPASLVERP